jgi:hypothetical protein
MNQFRRFTLKYQYNKGQTACQAKRRIPPALKTLALCYNNSILKKG